MKSETAQARKVSIWCKLPEIRRKGKRIIRTVSPATGEVLEWCHHRRAWFPEGGRR